MQIRLWRILIPLLITLNWKESLKKVVSGNKPHFQWKKRRDLNPKNKKNIARNIFQSTNLNRKIMKAMTTGGSIDRISNENTIDFPKKTSTTDFKEIRVIIDFQRKRKIINFKNKVTNSQGKIRNLKKKETNLKKQTIPKTCTKDQILNANIPKEKGIITPKRKDQDISREKDAHHIRPSTKKNTIIETTNSQSIKIISREQKTEMHNIKVINIKNNSIGMLKKRTISLEHKEMNFQNIESQKSF